MHYFSFLEWFSKSNYILLSVRSYACILGYDC